MKYSIVNLLLTNLMHELGYCITHGIALYAFAAAFCSCLLPESLQISSVRHDPEDQSYEYPSMCKVFYFVKKLSYVFPLLDTSESLCLIRKRARLFEMQMYKKGFSLRSNVC